MPKKKIETPESVDSGTLLLETSAENVADTAEAPTTPDSPETGALDPTSAPSPEEVTALPKPKRSSRVKKAIDEILPDVSPPGEQPEDPKAMEESVVPESVHPDSPRILTLEAGAEVETEENTADTIWHEIHNAYRTRRILTGSLGGIEQTESGKTLAIVDYKGYRIVIPLKEMLLNIPNNLTGKAYSDMIVRQHKLLSSMLGAEIDIIIRGIDAKTRSIVASRKEAMLKKRKTFFFDVDESGSYRIYDGRIVQARVIAVAEKAIRIEAFGAECSIMARDLSWDWIGDAHDRYAVGDQILVRITSVNRESLETLSIKADVKSTMKNRQNNIGQCRIQGKYAGKVTDVHKGVVYVRLANGVNAIAHSCYDRRMPGKKDDVSFAVTNIDEERGVALGIITRIIKQHL